MIILPIRKSDIFLIANIFNGNTIVPCRYSILFVYLLLYKRSIEYIFCREEMKITMLMLQKFDIYILSIINKYLRNKYMDTFMCIMTKLGDMGAIWIAIAFILLLDKTYRYMGKMIIITLVASTVLGEGILKRLIKRLRPCNEKRISNL